MSTASNYPFKPFKRIDTSNPPPNYDDLVKKIQAIDIIRRKYPNEFEMLNQELFSSPLDRKENSVRNGIYQELKKGASIESIAQWILQKWNDLTA